MYVTVKTPSKNSLYVCENAHACSALHVYMHVCGVGACTYHVVVVSLEGLVSVRRRKLQVPPVVLDAVSREVHLRQRGDRGRRGIQFKKQDQRIGRISTGT